MDRKKNNACAREVQRRRTKKGGVNEHNAKECVLVNKSACRFSCEIIPVDNMKYCWAYATYFTSLLSLFPLPAVHLAGSSSFGMSVVNAHAILGLCNLLHISSVFLSPSSCPPCWQQQLWHEWCECAHYLACPPSTTWAFLTSLYPVTQAAAHQAHMAECGLAQAGTGRGIILY